MCVYSAFLSSLGPCLGFSVSARCWMLSAELAEGEGSPHLALPGTETAPAPLSGAVAWSSPLGDSPPAPWQPPGSHYGAFTPTVCRAGPKVKSWLLVFGDSQEISPNQVGSARPSEVPEKMGEHSWGCSGRGGSQGGKQGGMRLRSIILQCQLGLCLVTLEQLKISDCAQCLRCWRELSLAGVCTRNWGGSR